MSETGLEQKKRNGETKSEIEKPLLSQIFDIINNRVKFETGEVETYVSLTVSNLHNGKEITEEIAAKTLAHWIVLGHYDNCQIYAYPLLQAIKNDDVKTILTVIFETRTKYEMEVIESSRVYELQTQYYVEFGQIMNTGESYEQAVFNMKPLAEERDALLKKGNNI